MRRRPPPCRAHTRTITSARACRTWGSSFWQWACATAGTPRQKVGVFWVTVNPKTDVDVSVQAGMRSRVPQPPRCYLWNAGTPAPLADDQRVARMGVAGNPMPVREPRQAKSLARGA